LEGLVDGLGQTVTALGQGLAQTAEGTLAPVLGPAAGGLVGGKGKGKGKAARGGRAKGKGAGVGDGAVILERRRAAPAPQNGGLVGGLLGGLVGGLGNVVSGLGTGLGATLDGTLSPLVGAAPVVVVTTGKQRKEYTPSSPVSSGRGGEGGRRRMGPATVLTTRDAVSCRRYPDAVQASPAVLPVYPLATALQVTCAAAPSLPGNSGRVDGDDLWLKTRDGCFVNRAEVRLRRDGDEGMDAQLAVPRCEEKPRHWVGMLQSQYSRADCYDCPSLDCPSKNVGEPPFVDMQCYEIGEMVRDDRLVLWSFGEWILTETATGTRARTSAATCPGPRSTQTAGLVRLYTTPSQKLTMSRNRRSGLSTIALILLAKSVELKSASRSLAP
jgi:hypothetical protein